MDDAMKHLRVRFSGAGHEDQAGSQTIRMPPQQGRIFGRDEMSNGEEYDAAYAAIVAAIAYAIAAREEEKQASQETPVKEKLPSQKMPVMNNEPSTAPTLKLPPNRDGGIMKKPRPTEGSRILRRFSGKELVADENDDEIEANVSVRRPVKPAQKKPEGGISGQNVVGKVLDSAPSIRKAPSFAKSLPERKGSMKFEQEQAIPTVPPNIRPAAPFTREKKESKNFDQDQAIPRVPPDVRLTTSFPREKKESKKFEQDQANQMPPLAAASSSSYSSEAQAMADRWEKEKLAKIKKQYNMTMDTIVEWEAEKKAKAKRQMEQKAQGDNSERKREKALEEYNDEMTRINKVAAASSLTAEEKRRSAERKVREKAERIRVTGKLPGSCGCF